MCDFWVCCKKRNGVNDLTNDVLVPLSLTSNTLNKDFVSPESAYYSNFLKIVQGGEPIFDDIELAYLDEVYGRTPDEKYYVHPGSLLEEDVPFTFGLLIL